MFYTSATQRYCPNGIVTASIVLTLSLTAELLYATQKWPSFRGLSATGVAEGYPTATEWDLESGENILWKTPIPGLAHSSPVIWGDQIFVTTAVKSEGESRLKVGLYGDIKSEEEDTVFDWRLYCVDRKTGKVVWNRLCHRGKPKVKRHAKSTHANATPCTDGQVVVVFLGAEGLYCYDVKGRLTWRKDLGVLDWGFFRVPSAQWGGGS
jgi:outer membrane protein assembly factor BamB